MYLLQRTYVRVALIFMAEKISLSLSLSLSRCPSLSHTLSWSNEERIWRNATNKRESHLWCSFPFWARLNALSLCVCDSVLLIMQGERGRNCIAPNKMLFFRREKCFSVFTEWIKTDGTKRGRDIIGLDGELGSSLARNSFVVLLLEAMACKRYFLLCLVVYVNF